MRHSKLIFGTIFLFFSSLTAVFSQNMMLEKDYEISRKAKKGYLGKVEEKDNVESLYARLKRKENKMYVEVLEKLCNVQHRVLDSVCWGR